jgi:taurine dioxygenase
MTTTAARADVRFEPVTGTVGELVRGVQLAGPHPAATVEIIRRTLHHHGVLFFEFDHTLSKEEFHGFASLFGQPEERYRLATGNAEYMDADVVPMKDVRVNFWHSDGTLFECPPQAAMLTPVEVPEAGGDTMWASMYAAWEDLSSHYQRLLEGVEALHSAVRLPFLKDTPTAVHPAVIRDPVTSRQLLFVNSNYTERILGMSDRESDSLLAMLFEHINTPEFHVRLRWRPGVVAVWEERVTQHRGVADVVGRRKLRRLTFPGDRPAA